MKKDEIYSEIKKIIKELFGKEDVEQTMLLSNEESGLGLSSLEIVELISVLEDFYNINIEFSVYFSTIEDIINEIKRMTDKD